MSVPWSFPEHVCPQREVEVGVAEMYAPPPPTSHVPGRAPGVWGVLAPSWLSLGLFAG